LNGTILWYDRTGELAPGDVADILSAIFFDGVALRGGEDSRSTISGREMASAIEELRAVATQDVEPEGPLGRIVAATIPLFRSLGYPATSTRDIAHAAGIQNSTLYHHLRDKEEVLFIIIRRAFAAVAHAMLSAVDGDARPLERISLLMQAHLVAILENQAAIAIALRDERFLTGERRAVTAASRAAIQAVIVGSLDAVRRFGAVRNDISTRRMSLAFFNMTAWSVFWYRSGQDHSPEQIGRLLSSVFIYGVRTGGN
jgi:AcrR family transcriptional regulator